MSQGMSVPVNAAWLQGARFNSIKIYLDDRRHLRGFLRGFFFEIN